MACCSCVARGARVVPVEQLMRLVCCSQTDNCTTESGAWVLVLDVSADTLLASNATKALRPSPSPPTDPLPTRLMRGARRNDGRSLSEWTGKDVCMVSQVASGKIPCQYGHLQLHGACHADSCCLRVIHSLSRGDYESFHLRYHSGRRSCRCLPVRQAVSREHRWIVRRCRRSACHRRCHQQSSRVPCLAPRTAATAATATSMKMTAPGPCCCTAWRPVRVAVFSRDCVVHAPEVDHGGFEAFGIRYFQ